MNEHESLAAEIAEIRRLSEVERLADNAKRKRLREQREEWIQRHVESARIKLTAEEWSAVLEWAGEIS